MTIIVGYLYFKYKNEKKKSLYLNLLMRFLMTEDQFLKIQLGSKRKITVAAFGTYVHL